jgi:hypothetical protein
MEWVLFFAACYMVFIFCLQPNGNLQSIILFRFIPSVLFFALLGAWLIEMGFVVQPAGL